MDITIYRYRTKESRWDSQNFSEEDISELVSRMNELSFQGEEEAYRYGFAQCNARNNIVYGLFVQKFPKKLTDYDPDTKEERVQTLPDSGEYLFLFYPERYELYLQTRRSADLPSQEQIIKRFIGVMQLAVSTGKFFFKELEQTRDEIDRERIIELFYQEAEAVTELELEGFDSQLVYDEKQKRGGTRQKYFNPIEEYQEAMEEATLRLGNDAEKVTMKAKQGHSFKKDPIARAALEVSRKPVKIVYTKDSETHVEYGITKKKEVLTIEATDFDLENQIDGILAQLSGKDTLRQQRPHKDDNQTSLV